MPQSPIGNDVPEPGATGWPWIARPVTVEPAESPDDFLEFADAFALALTVETVTSPPKIEIVWMSADALEVADAPGFAKAPYVTEPALTTEPSAG
jgi:hypothetical protein